MSATRNDDIAPGEMMIDQSPGAPLGSVHPQSDNYKNGVNHAVTYAVSVGLTYLIGKFEYIYHTTRQDAVPSIRQVANIACQSGLKGLGFNVVNNMLYSVVMLSVKDKAEKALEKWNLDSSLNRQAGGFLGGATALIATYPLSVFEAWRYEGVALSKLVSMSFPPKNMFKGLTAACLSDSTYYAAFFGFQPMFLNYFSKHSRLAKTYIDPISDAAAGLAAGIVCSPFSVISNCQKTSNRSIIEEVRILRGEGGLPRFYRGFATTGFIYATIFGLTAGAGLRLAETIREEPSVTTRLE